jgi:hypothetical protein
MAKAALKWKGNGFYVGVPARDLSADEVKRYGREFLLSLGLYEEIEKPRAVYKPPKDDIEEVEDNARY